MVNAMRHEPFSEIIQRALSGRGACKNDLEWHPEHRAPRYVVRMCEDLTRAIDNPALGKTGENNTELKVLINKILADCKINGENRLTP